MHQIVNRLRFLYDCIVCLFFIPGLLLLSMQVLHTARGHAEAVAVTTLTSTEATSGSMGSTGSTTGMGIVGSSSGSLSSLSSLKTRAASKDVEEDVVYQTVYACQDETLKISCLDDYSVKGY